MITEVRYSGFKGQDGAQTLTGRDIIYGPNGSGKSTRAQAIQLAILGYVPGNGKTASDTFKLTSGDRLSVGLTTDSGFAFDRVFERKASTKRGGAVEIKIEQEITVSPARGEKKTAEKEARIASELGSFPAMLDFSEFLSLSDLRRREFIYGLSAVDGSGWFDRDGIKIHLDSMLFGTVEEDNPEMATAMQETLDEAMGEYAPGMDAQQGLQAMHDYAKIQVSYWAKEYDKATAAAQKIAAYKNELEQTDRNLEANRARLADLHTALTDASVTLSAARERSRRIDAARERATVLEAETARIREEQPPREPEDLQTQIARIEGQLSEKTDYAAARAKIDMALAAARAEYDRATAERNAAWIEAGSRRKDVVIFDTQIKEIEAQHGVCVIDRKIKCTKDFGPFLAHLREEIGKAQAAQKAAEDRQDAAEAAVDAATQRIRLAEQQQAALQNSERSETEQRFQMERTLRSLQIMLTEAKGFDELKAQKLRARAEEMERLAPDAAQEPADLSEISARVEDLNTEIATLQDTIDEQQKTRTTLANLQNSMIDGKAAEYRKLCWKQISEAVGPAGLQGELVKSLLEPIRADVQEKLCQIGLDRQFFFQTSSERGKEVFQFGWTAENGTRVNFDALSTGEQMMLLIALMTAIIERRNPPLKLLVIDNINHLDRGNIGRVIAGAQAAGSRMDNILFLGVIDGFTVDGLDGWTPWGLVPAQQRRA